LRTFVQVLIDSRDSLIVLIFFIILAMVLFGSMMYFSEVGDWTVSSTYPTGAFLRNTYDQTGLEVSPFLSIAGSFWWVVVTVTTVGYGDFYPTSPAGKAVGMITMLSGVLTLALPITVIASNYANQTTAQGAEAQQTLILAEKLQRRRIIFSRKAASVQPKSPAHSGKKRKGITARQNPDPIRMLSCLAEINYETPWVILALLEEEIRAVHAGRAGRVNEPRLERELALDRFLIHALTMLRSSNSRIKPTSMSLIRRELTEFYLGFRD